MKQLRFVFVLALLLTAQETGAQQKFLMGYSSFSANQTPIWVAKEEGFFKRFGTDPDLILIEGGTRGAQALISGDLPIMGMSGQPVISARARGADLVMIAGTVNKMNYVLIGAPAVKKPEDLKAKGSAPRRRVPRHTTQYCSALNIGASIRAGIGSRFYSWEIKALGSHRSNRAEATRSSSTPVSVRP